MICRTDRNFTAVRVCVNAMFKNDGSLRSFPSSALTLEIPGWSSRHWWMVNSSYVASSWNSDLSQSAEGVFYAYWAWTFWARLKSRSSSRSCSSFYSFADYCYWIFCLLGGTHFRCLVRKYALDVCLDMLGSCCSVPKPYAKQDWCVFVFPAHNRK